MYRDTFIGLVATDDDDPLQRYLKSAKDAKVGDVVLCGGMYAYVNQIIHWHPDDQNRPKYPIASHHVAVQVKTDIGDRWWGYSLSDHD